MKTDDVLGAAARLARGRHTKRPRHPDLPWFGTSDYEMNLEEFRGPHSARRAVSSRRSGARRKGRNRRRPALAWKKGHELLTGPGNVSFLFSRHVRSVVIADPVPGRLGDGRGRQALWLSKRSVGPGRIVRPLGACCRAVDGERMTRTLRGPGAAAAGRAAVRRAGLTGAGAGDDDDVATAPHHATTPDRMGEPRQPQGAGRLTS